MTRDFPHNFHSNDRFRLKCDLQECWKWILQCFFFPFSFFCGVGRTATGESFLVLTNNKAPRACGPACALTRAAQRQRGWPRMKCNPSRNNLPSAGCIVPERAPRRACTCAGLLFAPRRVQEQRQLRDEGVIIAAWHSNLFQTPFRGIPSHMAATATCRFGRVAACLFNICLFGSFRWNYAV